KRAREGTAAAAGNSAPGQRRQSPRTTPAASTHDTCLGYYDVSGQYDKMFECNNTDHRYCCGTCFLRFCCEYKKDKLNQKACDNYQSPKWVQTATPSPVPTGDPYDPSMDQTNTAVYITCGVIAFIIVLGVSAKVAYDKATEPPLHKLDDSNDHFPRASNGTVSNSYTSISWLFYLGLFLVMPRPLLSETHTDLLWAL
uniref:Shisa N-terminal domain-containing protein n=1 Tax=Neogobius melanostomus TaxID=47308 RepID=A0A8C6TW94_9GOBI